MNAQNSSGYLSRASPARPFTGFVRLLDRLQNDFPFFLLPKTQYLFISVRIPFIYPLKLADEHMNQRMHSGLLTIDLCS